MGVSMEAANRSGLLLTQSRTISCSYYECKIEHPHYCCKVVQESEISEPKIKYLIQR